MINSRNPFPIFEIGDYPQGSYTEKDLDEIVESFDANDPPHIIVGHSSDYKGQTRIPSFGIITSIKRIGTRLFATTARFHEKLAEWIREGFYNQRSVELAKTSDGKLKLLALGMLGATPPAVKGLPAMDEALNEIAMQFSAERKPTVIEFATGISPDALLNIGEAAIADTMAEIQRYCGKMTASLSGQFADEDVDPSKVNEEMWGHFSNIQRCVGEHFAFMGKLSKLEGTEEETPGEEAPSEMAQTLYQKVKQFFNNKEVDMDKQKELQYQQSIAALEVRVKEFQDKENAAAAERAQAEEKAAELSRVTTIAQFCDSAIAENRMTPADREKDEPIMLTLAKTNADALVSFQQKYNKPVVPLEEITGGSGKAEDTRPEVIKQAEAYVKANPKEFAKLQGKQAISRAMFLHSRGKIKFAA